MPAVVVGGTGPGTLGLVRSLGQGGVSSVLLQDSLFAPATASRHVRRTVLLEKASGLPLVASLHTLANELAKPAALYITSDDAVLTVSQHRDVLAGAYRFLLPAHETVTALAHKTSFQQLAEAGGFPMPRTATIVQESDLDRLSSLRYPCIVKPTRAAPEYVQGRFARAYQVASSNEAHAVCTRILPVLPALVVQEWIEGSDTDLFFCLQYRDAEGQTLASFTGRKLSIWPAHFGITASCTAAPDAHEVLHNVTTAFFDHVGAIGFANMEYKRDPRTGTFFMIEPTIGRVDGQQEVATLHAANIPLIAHRHLTGVGLPRCCARSGPVIWRDTVSDWRARHGRSLPTSRAIRADATVRDAYWRLSDPLPALLHGSLAIQRMLTRRLRSAFVRSEKDNEPPPSAKIPKKL